MPGLADLPHHSPRAKRVIFLLQSGAPSQIDLFDPKPKLTELHGSEVPASLIAGQRLTTMTSDQKSKPLVQSPFKFAKHGRCGMELSELLPETAKIADELCLVRSMYTEAINHDPGITLLQTGSQLPGRPSIGAWCSYGLGSETRDLPSFVVMLSGGKEGQPLFGRLWGAGFLPARYQGVKLRAGAEPVLHLANPPGLDAATRRDMLDVEAHLNAIRRAKTGDAAIDDRIEQAELAFRMQEIVPGLVDLAREPESIIRMYGPEARQPGTFAANCLMARRLVEQGVRFVQLYHRDWDHHGNLPSSIKLKCEQTDRASAALVRDLRQRGLLDDTLVVWGGEFGRTVYCQGSLTNDNFGRDHHPRCFSLWMAGGGVKSGYIHGQTDDFSYNVVAGGVHIHDLQATLLHLLGIDHERFTYRYESRDYRLTDIAGKVVKEILR